MKRCSVLMLTIFLAITASGCGRDSHDSLRKQQSLTVKETADTLAAIKESATADAAKPKLKAVSERWHDIEKRQGTLAVPTPEQATELQRKHEAEQAAARQRLGEEAVRVATLPGGKEALDEVGDIVKTCTLEAFDVPRKQQVQAAQEGADLLTSIKDKASAEAAKPKLKQLGDRWRELKKAEANLPKPTAEQEAELKKRYEDTANGVKARFGQQAIRVATVPGGIDALREAGDIRDR